MVWFFIWAFLFWPPTLQTIYFGVPVAVIVYFVTKDFFSIPGDLFNKPSRYFWFLIYVIVFAKECVKANFDVAYRVIHPICPIRPGTVRVKTTLKSEVALTFLANSLSLTPGNTTIDIDRDRGIIYIHRLYLSDAEMARGRKLAVVEKYENILRRVFE